VIFTFAPLCALQPLWLQIRILSFSADLMHQMRTARKNWW